MCLAVPAKIIETDGQQAIVEIGGLRKQASIVLLPEAVTGDYVLLHAGFAISMIDKKEALETLLLFEELAPPGGRPGLSGPGPEDGDLGLKETPAADDE